MDRSLKYLLSRLICPVGQLNNQQGQAIFLIFGSEELWVDDVFLWTLYISQDSIYMLHSIIVQKVTKMKLDWTTSNAPPWAAFTTKRIRGRNYTFLFNLFPDFPNHCHVSPIFVEALINITDVTPPHTLSLVKLYTIRALNSNW